LSNLFPPDVDGDDTTLFDIENEKDKKSSSYKEEMSHAAVGRLFDDVDENSKTSTSSFVSGYDNVLDESSKTRASQPEPRDWSKPVSVKSEPKPVIKQRREPKQNDSWGQPEERQEPAVDRPRQRRGSTTTRLVQGEQNESDFDATGLREGRTVRERDRRRAAGNPDPKPAMRVNVTSEKPIDELTGEDIRIEIAEQSQQPPDDGFDDFRKRFNPGELVSSPRNPNRPVRSGSRDVRKDRIRANSREMEVINPLRYILAAGALIIVGFFIFLIVSNSNLRGYRDEADELRTAAASHEDEISSLRGQINTLQASNNELSDILDNLQTNDNQETQNSGWSPPNNTTAGNNNPPVVHPSDVEFPVYHTVQRGEHLNSIAMRWYGSAEPEILQHIATENNITNINRINAGVILRLTAMP